MKRTGMLSRVPSGVWALGFVSMFMDISSEMIHALLPVYLVTVLGVSMLTVGVIEGVAEALAMITKVFSGALSDWMQRRKLLTAMGYALSAFTKPIFPLAGSVGWIVAARFMDRVGKGVRGAPRDALIAELTTADQRGASYGLRQSLDTVGAFTGPLLAIGLMILMADNFQAVFWIAVIPAMLAVGIVIFGVKDAPRQEGGAPSQRPNFRDLKRFSFTFWAIIGVAGVLALARFSEAFLVLKAKDAGVPLAFVPAVFVVMNITYALSAFPAGVLSDRMGRSRILAAGAFLLLLADLLLIFASSIPLLLLAIGIWGLHMGLTQSLLAALVAEAAPEELRGTAFGAFNIVSGVALASGSTIAGALWEAGGPALTFAAGGCFAAFAMAGFIGLKRLTG